MRGRNYSKSSTYTESLKVYVTGISRKELRITRGDLSSRTNYHRREMIRQKSADGIVGSVERAEGQNKKRGKEPKSFDERKRRRNLE